MVQIFTDKEQEAIYEYSKNISNQFGIQVQLFFNGGHRQLKIFENGSERVYTLIDPKKPDDTPSTLRVGLNGTGNGNLKPLVMYMPVLVEQ